MKSKYYLIIIGILAVIIAALLFMQYSDNNYQIPVGDTAGEKDNENSYTNTSTWVKSQKFGLWYPPNARITESYYLSPVQQYNNVPENQGLPYAEFLDFPNSEMTIIWGGAQSGCGDGDYNFQYGVSTAACVKGVLAYMGMENVRYAYTTHDLKVFGDFVIKNK